MWTKGILTREQVVLAVGEAAVQMVEREECDYTGRCMPTGCDLVEFEASVDAIDSYGDDVQLSAFYYHTEADIDAVGGDIDMLDWEVHGYEVY